MENILLAYRDQDLVEAEARKPEGKGIGLFVFQSIVTSLDDQKTVATEDWNRQTSAVKSVVVTDYLELGFLNLHGLICRRESLKSTSEN